MNTDRRTLLQLVAATFAAPATDDSQTHEHAPLTAPPPKKAAPVFFNPAQYELLRELTQIILPPTGGGGTTIEAGVPEFIDLLASENAEYQRELSGGLAWLNAQCEDRYGAPFLNCGADNQREILDRIAYRRNAATDPALAPGIAFFALLRELTLDGYFTSPGGIAYLAFRGNQPLREFTGCPAPKPLP